MKREYEFRGKGVYAQYVNVKTGEPQLQWVYGQLRYLYDPFKDNGEKVDPKNESEVIEFIKRTLADTAHRTDKALICSRFGENEVLYDTIGQFTGMFDKNGKKIFEGDIIRYKYTETEFDTGAVTHHEYRVSVKFEYSSFRVSCYPFDLGRLEEMTDAEIEVIGNIYDNPELIDDSERLHNLQMIACEVNDKQLHIEYTEYVRTCDERDCEPLSYESWVADKKYDVPFSLKDIPGSDAEYKRLYDEYLSECYELDVQPDEFETWLPREQIRQFNLRACAKD